MPGAWCNYIRSKAAMKRDSLKFGDGFRVSIGNERSQAAQMVVAPGEHEGGSDNRHGGADQWLYVVSGTGLAIVNGKRYPLRSGSLLLIERGDTHEIRSTGRSALKTVNIYVPPAYTKDGEELGPGKP
jgi:mannose-6-phosphate isomerase-like protein (cupin superfamily)